MEAEEAEEALPEFVERLCTVCASPFKDYTKDWDEIQKLFGTKHPNLIGRRSCDPCLKKYEEEEALKERTDRIERWEDRVIPPLYRNTDLSHRGLSAEALKMVLSWDFKSGIGMVGDSGTGKTRLMFVALKRAAVESGRFGSWTSHNAFSVLVQNAFSAEHRADYQISLGNLRKCGLLFIDDLGKAPRTERADAEFEELVEYRVSHDLPILWTANAGGAWLEKRFGEDRGPALVRRLAQFCNCITIRP